MKNLIDYGNSGHVAAFIAESIQGVGGCIVFPDSYLKHAYEHVHAAGGLCIADEVQTGFSRTGTHYRGFETHGVIPDIVTMAKGIGYGCPLGAVVTTPKIAQTLAERLHFNTFGGTRIRGDACRRLAHLQGSVGEHSQVAHDDGTIYDDCALGDPFGHLASSDDREI